MAKQKTYSIERKQAKWGFLFTVPCLVFFAVFSFYPIINALLTSFTNRQAIARTSKWVGLQNYVYLFTQENAGFPLLNSMRATFTFTLGTFIPMVVISLILATLMMQLRQPGQRGFFQIAFYMPAVLSSVVAASIWMILFNPRGLVNQFSNHLLMTHGVDYRWLTDDGMLQWSTMIVYFWKYIGYFVILFITGLASIPPTLYEAAIVDGSSRWHTFWRITLPLLKPTVVLVSIMAMLQCLKTFSTQYMFVQNGAARGPIDVITMNIYYTGVRNGKLGRASAMSIILFVIMLALTYLQFAASKSDDVEY
ncbi:MAG: sugar ABC transporter permease [Sphaerochaeta sp.]|jgi:multiple sugar transport system permease protein|nr:sugar ABC transporter permease [Sphaerochaeta sp.]MCH3919230.1 sugar ABC transporter permease [Sphaerochaeta sp.]MCI2076259.1 sugar ABC transporter permease [Sphaerochaeta sp.]MCI2097175.1 sugar ABC transporter permease [Sphaerochaeta sp.]MCI2104983.1 sugar ABC transporter permease [Sphaerochaeta sp.]